MRHQINKRAKALICRMFNVAQNLTTMHENDNVLILPHTFNLRCMVSVKDEWNE